MNKYTIRFNYGRMVATFDDKETMDKWILNCDLNEEYMYTIHGLNEVTDIEKYKKILNKA